MERQTILANKIDTIGKMSAYDEACKSVLANKTILAWILKYALKEYAEQDIEMIAEKYIEGKPAVSDTAVHMDETAEFIEGANTESSSLTEKTVTFDIKFKAVAPPLEKAAEMFINIEAQSDFYPKYPIIKRGIYYSGRMISSQYGTVFEHSHYEKLKRVVSIWICPYPPKHRKNSITYYHLKEESLYGSVKEDINNYDLISVVIICLGDGDGDRDSKIGNPLLQMLSVLLSPKIGAAEKKRLLQTEFHIPMTEKTGKDVLHMCNLSIGVFETGYNDGFDDGFNDGIISAIKNMSAKKGWDIETCMDILDIPPEKQETYKSFINK